MGKVVPRSSSMAQCGLEQDEPGWLTHADATLSDLMSREVLCSDSPTWACLLRSEGLQLQKQACRLASEASKSARGRQKRRIRHASRHIEMATRWLIHAVGEEYEDNQHRSMHARSTLSELKRPYTKRGVRAWERRKSASIAGSKRHVEILP